MSRLIRGALPLVLGVTLAGGAGVACAPDAHHQARQLIAERCASCHLVPGVPSATGRVGPSLGGIGRQQILAGRFANDRRTLERWIRFPQELQPGSAMPSTGLTEAQASVIAEYLITLE